MTQLPASLLEKLRHNPFLSDFSPSEQAIPDKMAEERLSRARRVGVLLREIHYLATSKPHYAWDQMACSEDQFWTDYALSAPGLEETALQAEFMRRKAELTTAHSAQAT